MQVDLFEEDAEDGLPKFELLSKNPRADSVTNSKVSATSPDLADWIDCSEEMAASKKHASFIQDLLSS